MNYYLHPFLFLLFQVHLQDIENMTITLNMEGTLNSNAPCTIQLFRRLFRKKEVISKFSPKQCHAWDISIAPEIWHTSPFWFCGGTYSKSSTLNKGCFTVGEKIIHTRRDITFKTLRPQHHHTPCNPFFKLNNVVLFSLSPTFTWHLNFMKRLMNEKLSYVAKLLLNYCDLIDMELHTRETTHSNPSAL